MQVLLSCAPEHLTLDEIHQRVAELGWHHIALRRTLDDFTRSGLTHCLFLPGPVAYGLADPPHHHVLCDTCGGQVNIPAATLTPAITAAQAASGYHLHRSGLTLLGRCLACQDDNCRVGVTACLQPSTNPYRAPANRAPARRHR